MRRFLVYVIAMIMIFSLGTVPVVAEENVVVEEEAYLSAEYTSGNYKYTINEDGKTATITEYLGSEADIVVPSKIDGYTVTIMGGWAFYKVKADSITVPDSVTTLDESSFAQSQISSITLGDNITKIGKEAFINTNFKNLIIPASVTTIEEGALIALPFEVEDGNTSYKKVGDCLFTMDDKTLLAYEQSDYSGEFTVPDTVTRIGAYGLFAAKYSKIIIPDSVTSLGEYSLKSVWSSEIVIGNGVTVIEEGAFENVYNCKSITIPGNVKRIGSYAFCNSTIEEIVLCEGIETIEGEVFCNCPKLKSVKLPASLKSIEGSALTYAYELKNIEVAEENESYKVVDNVLYSLDGTVCVAYPRGKEGEEYVVPEGVITVGANAFHSNENLKKVYFANTVEVIEERAFQGCKNLEKIVLPGNVKKMEHYTFAGCSKLNGVFLPAGMESFGHMVFMNCNELTDIYYVGDEEDWKKVDTGYMNEILDASNILFLGNLKDFVERLYTVALGREYDLVGLNGWVQMLVEETHDGAGLAKEFILGQEFALRGLTDEQYVDVLYKTFFNRDADEAGKQLWLATLATGATREYVLSNFVNLDEFTLLCADYGIHRGVMLSDGSVAAPGLPQFVGRLYDEVLGRSAENDGLNNWTVALATGTVTAEEAAVNFFTSQEYAMKNTDSQTFVTDLYSVFMDREADAEGLSFWVTCLEDAGVSREWVISEFAKSDEFKIIAAKYGL